MRAVLGVIPYEALPALPAVPLLDVRVSTFVALSLVGLLLTTVVGTRYAARFGVERADSYWTLVMVVPVALVGARLSWALANRGEVDGALGLLAVDDGGLSLVGGCLAGLVVAWPLFTRWERVRRWNVLDGWALALVVGLVVGRLGSYAAGLHLGRESAFALATRYDGGRVQEQTLGGRPLEVGMSFHNAALYELLHLVVLLALMLGALAWARYRGRGLAPGLLAGGLLAWYGLFRFATDILRVNDNRVLGLTGAQWFCLVLLPAGVYVLVRVCPVTARAVRRRSPGGTLAGLLGEDEEEDDEVIVVPDELEAPEDDEDRSYLADP